MRGDLLALGATAALALGVRARRGAANTAGWPQAVPQLLRMRAENLAERYADGAPYHELGVVLGRGETRVVYTLGEDFVVKVPRRPEDAGFNVNEAETWAKASRGLRALLVPVLEADPDGAWLIMPRVRTQLTPGEKEEARRLCVRARRHFDFLEPDCDHGNNVGARADGRLFLFDYALDPDDLRSEEEMAALGYAVGSRSLVDTRLRGRRFALALAGTRKRRGAANITGWPETVPQILRMRAEKLAEQVLTDKRRGREGFPRCVDKRLGTYLGEGETRIVYALDANFVVKVPVDPHHAGFNQNEADTWAKAPRGLRALLVPVLESDPGGAWLIMPRVRTSLDNDERERAKKLCGEVSRRVDVRYTDCDEGQNVGARIGGELFVFDYPFDPDDVPDEDLPRLRGSRATTPLPASFPPTEIGLLTRSAFLDLRNPDEKFHPETAYDFDLAKMNRPRLDLHATHRDRRGDETTLWIPDRPYGTPVPDPVREAILRDATGTLAVLHDGVLHHAHRVRPQDIPRTWWRPGLQYARRFGNAREEPTQLGIDRTQVVKYPEPLEKLVSDVTAINREHYPHLLQRIVVKNGRYEIRSAGVPVPDRGTSLAILDAQGQKVAEATDEWGATLVVVAQELRGRGLGPILTRAWYDLNPRYRSGGFTRAGRDNAVRTWETRVREFLDRGWYSDLVKQGRMTAAQVLAIQAGLSGKRAPSPLPADLPKTGPTPDGHALLAYVDGPTFVLYDSRFLADPDEQWIRAYGFFRDASVRGTHETFLYRIEYEATHRVQATLAALQLAKNAGWPVYVGPGYGDLVELDGLEDRVVRKGERVRLRTDALPLRDMGRLEAKIRARNDPYREMESRLLEAAEGKWA